ncbi:hypothetical protein GSI_05306 [Ganoderma sinense ZZ0214-1]|uniref:SMODS and SLOG-associating 2TM effector domain-containing protein n=1 Tax=Ganoderma sinense ZZ0214-1 TaxID=1077348 RepID=A0A2G8SFS6_9APHY|nr:hypothetical protein GSI_05306 [Ganoderma sinense ZZ0214-1]
MSSDQQGITHPAVSPSASDETTTGVMRPASQPDHADTSSLTATAPPQPATSAHIAPSSSPHLENVESALQSQSTSSSVTAPSNQPAPSPLVPKIATESLPMSTPTSGYYGGGSGGDHHPEQFTSSPYPISPSSAHIPGSGVDTSPVQNTTPIPVLAQQTNTYSATVPTSESTPGPVTATSSLPSKSPNAPIVGSVHTQRDFHDSGPATAGSAVLGPSRRPTEQSIEESANEDEDDVGPSHGNILAQTQAHGYEHSFLPVAGPSGQTNAVTQTQSQRTASTPPHEHPSYVPPPARGPTVHTNVGDVGNAAGIGAGYTSGAGNGYNTPALGTRHGQRAQSSSPGRRTSSRTVSYTEPPLPSRAADRYPLPMTTPAPNTNPPVPSAVGAAKSLPMPPPAHHGNGSGDLVMSPQPDATAMHRSELDWAVPYMSGSHPAGHGNAMGMQGMPGGMGGANGTMPGSRHDSRRASAYTANGGGNGTPGAHRRSMSMAATLVTANGGEKCIADRLIPTLEAAERELISARRTARIHGWALNAAIGAQVVLGALTTGVAAATTGRSTSVATSILGGMSTLAASYLAKARGSGEPDASAKRAQDLESFIRDLQAFVLDHGHLTVGAGDGVQPEYGAMVARYRRRFEEIMGHALEGVEDTLKAEKQKEEMMTAVASRAKAEKSMV